MGQFEYCYVLNLPNARQAGYCLLLICILSAICVSVVSEVVGAQYTRVGEAVANNKYTAHTENGSAIALTRKGFDTLRGGSFFERSVYVLLGRLRLPYTAHIQPNL